MNENEKQASPLLGAAEQVHQQFLRAPLAEVRGLGEEVHGLLIRAGFSTQEASLIQDRGATRFWTLAQAAEDQGIGWDR
jgi:hypothetical protein